MSFFGLTAFGPENYIRSSNVANNGFTLFYDEEFKTAYDKVTKLTNSEKLVLRFTKEFLHHTFGFAPLDEEVQGNVSNLTNSLC